MPTAKFNLREWSLLPPVEILWLSETSDDLSPADLELNEIVNEHMFSILLSSFDSSFHRFAYIN